MFARAVAAGVDVAAIIAGTDAPLAPVRFQVLLQKALEVCQEVKSLGAQILAALEKKDNEALGILRAKHETNLLSLAEAVRFSQWKEAEKNLEGGKISLDNAFQRFRYYERLLGREAAQIKQPGYDSLKALRLALHPQIEVFGRLLTLLVREKIFDVLRLGDLLLVVLVLAFGDERAKFGCSVLLVEMGRIAEADERCPAG
jgi:hypothetical protein